MSSCPSCARAVHDPLHRDYRSAQCPGCAVRKLAHMPAAERERMYLRLQHLMDGDAVKRIQQDVRLELAKIKKLCGVVLRRKERA